MHPGFLTADHMEILDGRFGSRNVRDVFGYRAGWELPSDEQRAALAAYVRSIHAAAPEGALAEA